MDWRDYFIGPAGGGASGPQREQSLNGSQLHLGGQTHGREVRVRTTQ